MIKHKLLSKSKSQFFQGRAQVLDFFCMSKHIAECFAMEEVNKYLL